MHDLRIHRLGPRDVSVAREVFAMMVDVFNEDVSKGDGGEGDGGEGRGGRLTDDYLRRLLGQDSFWALAAAAGPEMVGGLTAHTLPMTRSAASEGIGEVFVPADNEDTHALDFYRAQGATESPVTFFSFTST